MKIDGHIIHNKKRYLYKHGGCGQAVYIFEDEAQYAKWLNSYDDKDVLVIVPDEDTWPATAKKAISVIKRQQKKQEMKAEPIEPKLTVAQRIVKFIYG